MTLSLRQTVRSLAYQPRSRASGIALTAAALFCFTTATVYMTTPFEFRFKYILPICFLRFAIDINLFTFRRGFTDPYELTGLEGGIDFAIKVRKKT
jgi:hypothetical protein